MFRDFKELLSAFNAQRVRYLVVGGYAVSFHAQPRATKDLDLLISADTENSKAVYAALAQFGAPVEGLSAQDFTDAGSFFRMGTPPVMVDIFPSIGGVDFEEAWHRRVDVAIDDDLSAPFISHEDLLAAKISAGRPQDLADVAALREAEPQRGQDQRQTLASGSDVDETKRRGREAWLKLRQQGVSLTPEESRSKGREDWLKLRHQQAEGSRDSSDDKREKEPDQKDAAKGPGLGIDEDPGS
jgi:hypothetical protein